MSDTLVSVVAAALAQILTKLKPESGNMAFVRCLPGEIAGRLVLSAARDGLAGWRVAFVTESDEHAEVRIGAAQAVELRETKGNPTLLVIDPEQPGAGLDGIFSATTEIRETELFLQAVKEAQKRLPHGFKAFASKALSKAGWQKRRQPLAPWPALDYLCRACDDTLALGRALPLIGLWPIALGAHPDPKDLEQSVMLVERLLPTQGARPAPPQRVGSLNLGPEQQTIAEQLVVYLQSVDSLPRQQALDGLLEHSPLWLNNLRLPPPGELQGIKIQPWRQANGNIYAWSGLRLSDGHELEYRINLDQDAAAAQQPLVVKWRVTPPTLPKGSVTFQVDVVAGQDTLASKSVGHNGKAEQKIGFSRDEFDELDEQARFQALIRVSVLGESALQPEETESFVLCFGKTSNQKKDPGAVRSAATLALAAAEVAPSWDAFKELGRHPASPIHFETATHGFILCKWQGKVAPD